MRAEREMDVETLQVHSPFSHSFTNSLNESELGIDQIPANALALGIQIQVRQQEPVYPRKAKEKI